MTNARAPRPRRLLARALLLSFVLLAVAATWACPQAGRFLVVEDPPHPADAIVVLAGPRAERWLEATDLYKEKVAPKILLSSGRIEPAETLLRERGIRFPREVDLGSDAMVQIGVPPNAIHVFPDPVDNTAAEAAAARTIAAQQGWRSLVVVTSKYHTRRARYAFERAFRGTGVTIQVRGSRYDQSHPDQWWKHRADLRFVISELQKLVAYRLGVEG